MASQFVNSRLQEFILSIETGIMSLEEMNLKINRELPTFSDDLKLGKIEVFVSAPQTVYEPCGFDKKVISFISPKGYSEEPYSIIYQTDERGSIKMRAWPLPGVKWNEVEKTNIEFFNKICYFLCGRARLTNLMSSIRRIDGLTGALNMHGFQEAASEILMTDEISTYAVVSINLKNFKFINQQLSLDSGDILLTKYTLLIKAFVENEGLVARLGGDNFIILIKKALLSRFLDFLKNISISINNKGEVQSIKIDVRAGIYEAKEDTNFGDIMSNASVALMWSKNSKEEDFVFFKQEMLDKAIHDNGISIMFMDSLAKKEFKVYYQPKVNLETNTICGCEALSRWHSQRLIMPNEFIPVLEKEGSIKSLDFYVLDEICRNIRDWLDRGIKPVIVSTNFSKLHLTDEHFEENIIKTLKKYNIPSKYLELELTELSDFQYFDRLVTFVTTMKENGFKISIDDFGTGYSSMSLLRNLSPDIIKLDKSLIDNVGLSGGDKRQKVDRIISRSIINMAKELGIEVIAEGVETREQAEFLRSNGCVLAQGFLFDKALPHDDFEKRLKIRKYNVQ